MAASETTDISVSIEFLDGGDIRLSLDGDPDLIGSLLTEQASEEIVAAIRDRIRHGHAPAEETS